MTYSSSLNSHSNVKVGLRLEFGGQELSNDVFNCNVRRREYRLWYMANQTDGISTSRFLIPQESPKAYNERRMDGRADK